MASVFSNILVPVNFNKSTPVALEKAIQVANEYNCDIHLLYTKNPVISYTLEGLYVLPFFDEELAASDLKMKQLAAEFSPKLLQGRKIHQHTDHKDWFTATKNYIISNNIDLVIIAQPRNKIFGNLLHEININRLAQKTQCPVLTVNRYFNLQHLKNILVPVQNFLPVRKLRLAAFFASKFHAAIHLMGLNNGNPQENKQVMEKAYRLLKTNVNVEVKYVNAADEQEAEDTLSYAQKIAADMIVVNTGKESLLKKSFLHNWFGKYLYRESGIPVLTVSPIN